MARGRAGGGAGPGWAGTFAARPESVAQARIRVTGWLREAMPAERLLIGDVGVAVSEACTNVVMHAYPDGDDGVFRVSVDRADNEVRVTVSDGGDGMVPRPDGRGRGLGLGLPLIASLADAVDVRPAADGAGTVVAMRFSAAGSAARPAHPAGSGT